VLLLRVDEAAQQPAQRETPSDGIEERAALIRVADRSQVESRAEFPRLPLAKGARHLGTHMTTGTRAYG
jgi:hypothetical protein